MLDTLDRLRARGSAARHGADLRGLRRALRGERLCLRRESLERPQNRKRIVRSLALAKHRIGRWRPGGDDRRIVRAGIKRIYRSGRKAHARVEGDRSVENCTSFARLNISGSDGGAESSSFAISKSGQTRRIVADGSPRS